MPETAESRLLRIEREVAILAERFVDLRARVNDLQPLALSVTRLESAAITLEREVTNIRTDLAKRDNEASTDRRATRTALWGLTSAIVATIIGAIVALLIAAPH